MLLLRVDMRTVVSAMVEYECSDPTSDGQVSVLQCHPWIGNADTHSTQGFITE